MAQNGLLMAVVSMNPLQPEIMTSKIKLFALPIPLLLIAGCGTTVGLSPKVEHSGFDNARIVNIAPHGNAPSGMLNVMLSKATISVARDSGQLGNRE